MTDVDQRRTSTTRPVGQIFAAGRQEPASRSTSAPKNQPVRDAVENAVRSVEQGQRDADRRWTEAVKDAKKAAGADG